jgi:ribose transport system permease protein
VTAIPASPAAGDLGTPAWRRRLRLHGWTIGVWIVLLAMLPYWRTVSSGSFSFDFQTLAIGALPLCFAAMAQAVVVISGGIDLSVGSLIGLMNVVSARWMIDMSTEEALLFTVVCLVIAGLAGALTGLVIVVTRIPDIVVTLGMLFVWYGVALWVLTIPGGGAPQDFYDVVQGTVGSTSIPWAIVILAVAWAALWLSIRWLRPGLSFFAVGSSRNAAYLSGIDVARTRVGAYALAGVFCGLGGVALTTTSFLGDPNAGRIYTLNSVAAIVLGGVSLLGGIGGLIGPIGAAFILTLINTILVQRGTDPNYAAVYTGVLIIVVVMIGGLLQRRGRT